MDTFFPLPSSFAIYPGDHTAVSIVWMNYNLSSILLMIFSCFYSFAIQIAQQCITTCVGLFLFLPICPWNRLIDIGSFVQRIPACITL